MRLPRSTHFAVHFDFQSLTDSTKNNQHSNVLLAKRNVHILLKFQIDPVQCSLSFWEVPRYKSYHNAHAIIEKQKQIQTKQNVFAF